MSRQKEYDCDRCGQEVPNGNGYYLGDDRVCRECSTLPKSITVSKTVTYHLDTAKQLAKEWLKDAGDDREPTDKEIMRVVEIMVLRDFHYRHDPIEMTELTFIDENGRDIDTTLWDTEEE